MKRVLIASIALALLLPVSAFAQSAFNGTWETQLSSVRSSGEPIVIRLRDGTYACNCVPPIKVKADGQDHAVTGHDGFDTVAVQVVNQHTVRIVYKRRGKVVSQVTDTMSADGKTGTYEFKDNSGPSPVTGKAEVVRVAPGAAGANAVDGAWKLGHWIELSANARTFTYKVDGNSIRYGDPAGGSYDGEIGGKAVAYVTPGAAGQTVSVQRLGPNELRETYRRDGKVTRTSTMTVAEDGKTMKTVNRNLETGREVASVADRE